MNVRLVWMVSILMREVRLVFLVKMLSVSTVMAVLRRPSALNVPLEWK